MTTRTSPKRSELVALVARVRDGDDNAWDALYPHLLNVLCYAVKRMGANADEALDVAHDVLEWFLHHADKVIPESAPAYLAQRADWRYRDILRSRDRANATLHLGHAEGSESSALNDADRDPAQTDPEAPIEERVADRELAERALAHLTERERTLVALKARGLSHREAAEKLGIALGTVGPTVWLFRRRLARAGLAA